MSGDNSDNDSSDRDEYVSFSDSDSSSSDDSFSSMPSLSSSINSFLCDVPKNLNILHINAQSIPAHYPDLLASFENKNIHAILVSESWFKPCLPSTSYSLPGFKLIRNDRSGVVGGGVAIYLRAHFHFSIVSMSAQPPPSNAGEHLFIEIDLPHTKVLLGVYYCPSSSINFFLSLETLLENLVASYDHSIIMGDFNTCLLKQDSRSASLNSLARACNLNVLPLSATHFYPNSTPSLLDLILVSSPALVAKHGQCAAGAFSFHDLIYLSYKIRPPKSKPKVILQRNFGGMDLEALQRDADAIDWSQLAGYPSVDAKVEHFTSVLIELYDKHAPLREIKLKHLPAPWITPELRSLMNKKVVAKAQLKNKPTDHYKNKYLECRNRCNRVCRDAQRRYIHNSVEDSDPAKVWKFLRSLGIGKSREPDKLPLNLDSNSLNKHFTSASNLDNITKSQTLLQLSSIPIPDYPSFSFNQFTDCDVKKSIASISSKAIGNDCISRNMIVPILDQIVPIIRHILNYSISSGVFPALWKEAQVTPLPKKSNPTSFSDFRPISILPFLSKVLERLVHRQLTIFLSRNHLLNPFQSGFRSGHSTVSALVNITDDIREGMDNGRVTILTLLDFSSAFNNVDFEILLGILRSLNISPTVVDWFHSYLYGRRQRIRMDESYSSWCNISAGVPQGGVLSPLLFAIFINTISQQLTSSYHLYADDLQIYTQSTVEELPHAIHIINCDLGRILDWSKAYGLSVNPLKTQLIIVGGSRMVSRIDWDCLPQVIFDGTHIKQSETVKNLGVLIDRQLSWGPQLTEVSRRMFASAGSLRRLRNFLPIATKISLAQSLLLPILDYADACYLDLTEQQLNKLERMQNFGIRFIFGLRKYDHVSEFRRKLKWLPIRLRRNTHILNLLYNILFSPTSPPYLKDRFQFLHLSNSRSLRSSETLQLKSPVHSSSYFDKSFTMQAARLWNALPVAIRCAKSLFIFKSMVKEHYLSCCH